MSITSEMYASIYIQFLAVIFYSSYFHSFSAKLVFFSIAFHDLADGLNYYINLCTKFNGSCKLELTAVITFL